MLLQAPTRFFSLTSIRLLGCLWLFGAQVLQAQPSLDVMSGNALFERNWISAPASTTASDGLGPFYNARSCSACHPAGGRGSGWQALTLRIDDPVYGRQLQSSANAGLAPEVQLTFDYASATLQFPDGQQYPVERVQPSLQQLRYGALQSGYSARLAPSLYGLGALSRVSTSVLEALADPDDRDADGISGRPGRAATGAAGASPGRFGWKADSPNLSDQIAKAFSLDIGMSSPAYPSAWGDCTLAQHDCLQQADGSMTGSHEFELAGSVLELVLAYVESFVPHKDKPLDSAGLAVFEASGCSACHVPELEPGLAAFTDLLLHDMGPGLASGLEADYPLASEWRTAPLWNLAPGMRFLHDGRAQSLEAAILWHGGEAERAREAYRALNPEQKQRLLEFLFTL